MTASELDLVRRWLRESFTYELLPVSPDDELALQLRAISDAVRWGRDPIPAFFAMGDALRAELRRNPRTAHLVDEAGSRGELK